MLSRKVVSLLVALVSGVLLAMCYPGFEYAGGLVWVWSAPLMLVLWLGVGGKKRFAFLLGWLSGAMFWLINVKWLIAMGELPTVPVAGALLGWVLLSFYLALYFGVWGLLVATVGNPWRLVKVKEMSGVEAKIAKKEAAAKVRGRVSGVKESLRVIAFASFHASSWVVLEWLRGWLMTGFGWNGLGVAFHDVPVIMQVADLVGVTGLAFLPIFVVSVVLQTGRRMIEEVRAGRFKAHFEIGIAIGLVALVFSYGVNRMAFYTNAEKVGVKVLLVQENIEQRMKWDEAEAVGHYMGYGESTRQALAELAERNDESVRAAIEAQSGEPVEMEYPDMVIFPESALTQPLGYVEGMEGVLVLPMTMDLLKNGLMEGEHFHVVFGSNLLEAEEGAGGFTFMPEGKMYNAMAVARPEVKRAEGLMTTAVELRSKSHLVPFGEYIPDIPMLGKIMEWTSGSKFPGSVSSSDVREPLVIELGTGEVELIPSICFEDTVGRLTRQFVREKPQMIVNITNDGWFGKSEAARQHMANSKFRCVELRRPMARAANTGVSGIVSVLGGMESGGVYQGVGTPEDPFVKGTYYGKVEVLAAGRMTLYALMGDWFVVFCLMLAGTTGVILVKID